MPSHSLTNDDLIQHAVDYLSARGTMTVDVSRDEHYSADGVKYAYEIILVTQKNDIIWIRWTESCAKFDNNFTVFQGRMREYRKIAIAGITSPRVCDVQVETRPFDPEYTNSISEAPLL